MSEDIQKIRSPNSPKFDLNQAIEYSKKLHAKIGRSAVKAEIAVGAIGYNGLNGAALGTLGAISQYGLVERSGGNVQITPLALKILHPVDDAQKAAAMKEAALSPKVFSDIYEKWNDMTEDVLANHLIHQKFIPEAAKRAASVYKLNYDIAKLGSASQTAQHEPEKPASSSASEMPQAPRNPDTSTGIGGGLMALIAPRPKMLATFKIPIGAAEAEIIFTGERLEAEDFDALRDYVDLFKKQYTRKVGIAAQMDAFLKGTLTPGVPPTTPPSA
jgi:hypothetical protein